MEVNDYQDFLKEREVLGQKEKEAKSFDIFDAVGGQSVVGKIKECGHSQNFFKCRKLIALNDLILRYLPPKSLNSKELGSSSKKNLTD